MNKDLKKRFAKGLCCGKTTRGKSDDVRVGVSSLDKAAKRLSLLDKVLGLFGMRIGAYQTTDLDIQGDKIVGIRLTVYFTEHSKCPYKENI